MMFEYWKISLLGELSARLQLFRVQSRSLGEQQEPHWIRILTELQEKNQFSL